MTLKCVVLITQVGGMFFYNVIQCQCIAYNVVALLAEINTIKLLQVRLSLVSFIKLLQVRLSLVSLYQVTAGKTVTSLTLSSYCR